VVADSEGFLSFVGRDDEMIKTSGNRVSPTEVEEAALASGAVAECVALGVGDERLGQAILLIARPPAGIDAVEAERRLRADLRQRLPSFMQPRDMLWRDSLPRNPNGKLDRAALRAEVGA
jgi:acyl-coenzyme A synthetase/AMP-(fatty) acid ligase